MEPKDQVTVQWKGPPGKTQHWPHSHPIHSRTGGSFKQICVKYRIQTHFEVGNRTLKQLLAKPKDQDPTCGEITCNKEYIGETSGILGERYREQLKEPSSIHVHSWQTGHNATPGNFNIIGKEDQGLARTRKESI